VRDTGIGIAPEVVPHLFMAFIQADSTTTRKFGGTGLGLAICRRLVELMGGRIWVDSEPGKGSDFRFWIPLPVVAASTTPAAADTPRSRGFSSRWSGRALVVEDTPLSQRLAVLMTTAVGLEVATANNGLEAVDQFKQGHFDLVLMDCNMPELDGYGAARAIREVEAARGVAPGQGVWIVALTANALLGDREQCLAAGMNDYLTKPLTTAQFASALGRSPLPRKPVHPPA
jgi:CheY-like chemotaxis protein